MSGLSFENKKTTYKNWVMIFLKDKTSKKGLFLFQKDNSKEELLMFGNTVNSQ